MTTKKSPATRKRVAKKAAPRAKAADKAADEKILNEALVANKAFNEENEALRKELEQMKTLLAKDNPSIIRKMIEPEQVGQDGTARFDEEGLIKPEQKTLDDPDIRGKLEKLEFYKEEVTIRFDEVADENADPRFTIWHNGIAYNFSRGEEFTVPRYVVSELAEARRTGYGNKLVVDRVTGEQSYEYPSHTGLRYPFVVVEDRNPQGAQWYRAKMRSAQ